MRFAKGCLFEEKDLSLHTRDYLFLNQDQEQGLQWDTLISFPSQSNNFLPSHPKPDIGWVDTLPSPFNRRLVIQFPLGKCKSQTLLMETHALDLSWIWTSLQINPYIKTLSNSVLHLLQFQGSHSPQIVPLDKDFYFFYNFDQVCCTYLINKIGTGRVTEYPVKLPSIEGLRD